jgi:hypothetical protein
MTRRFENLREHVANAITHHPGNRTGTPEQRHPVSLMLADAVLRVVRPCTCDADPIECSHEAARGQAEAERDRLLTLLRDLTDDDPCRFDHRGGCQAHGYLSLKPGEVCPHAEAKELLASVSSTQPAPRAPHTPGGSR